MSPRPRSKRNNGLPPNLYAHNNGTTFRYRRPDDGTWHGMGSDKAKAIAAARQLNSLLMAGSDLVGSVMGGAMSVEKFIGIYEKEILPGRELAAATLSLYAIRLRQISKAIGDKSVDSVTIRDISKILESMPPRSSNQLRKIAIDLFAHAVARGLSADNPAASTIARIEKKQRERHTVEGLAKIRAAAPAWLQNAIDLALVTTQARDEILRMKFADVRDGRLYVVRQKTARKSDSAYVSMKVTPQLEAVIQRCRDNTPSPYLVHRIPERQDKRQRAAKEHWTQVTNNYLSHAFQEARDSANPYPDLEPVQQPGFHEIRALALHLYKKAGKPIEQRKKLAAHAGEQMTKNYEADHDEIIWSEADPDLDISPITDAKNND